MAHCLFATNGSKNIPLFLKKEGGFGGEGKTFFPVKKSFSLPLKYPHNLFIKIQAFFLDDQRFIFDLGIDGTDIFAEDADKD